VYQIKLDQFEGPLELLLKLIEEQRLDITRLSLAKVTDQYLKYIENKETVTLEHLAEFLTVASKLILIKSKALLPTLELSQEEEEEIRDLEAQLAEYRKFKEAAKKIGSMAGLQRTSFSRESFLGIGSFFYPPKDMNAYDLKKFFSRILSEIPEIKKLEEEMVREVITMEEKIAHLQEVLRKRIETTFSEITNGAKDKIEIIVSFLAMLEMVKQRIVQVEQGELFKDIKIKVAK
jgi:segregation and condensation protein A